MNCNICKKDFTPTNRAGPKPKVCPSCKPVQNRRRVDRWRSNGGVQDKKKNNLKVRYGLTPEQHENMLKEVDFKCPICGSQRNLVVDHDHSNGKVRSILCNECNLSLGWAKDDPTILRRLADYAERHST